MAVRVTLVPFCCGPAGPKILVIIGSLLVTVRVKEQFVSLPAASFAVQTTTVGTPTLNTAPASVEPEL